MRTLALMIFGVHKDPKSNGFRLIAELNDACGCGIQLLRTMDPIEALYAINQLPLEVVHLVNEASISYHTYSELCETLAEEMAMMRRNPLVNIGDPKLRFLGTSFRNQEIAVSETDLKTAVARRWRFLQTLSLT